MVITLSLFYYLYLVLVGVFLVFVFFELYHLLKFGFWGGGTIFLIIILIIVSGLILFWSGLALTGIDWSEPLNFFLTGDNFNNL